MTANQRNTQAVQVKTTSYRAGKLLVRLLLGCVTRVRVIRRENADRTGGFLLAANHISHFDPFIISSVTRRKIDWMTMAEFFQPPVVGFLLRAVDAFPVDRDRADRKTIRTAIERLKEGRILGLFPEGGIRDGARSLLEGAPLRPGASTLAHIAGVPILPCVIVGSDRLYSAKRWLPASGGRTSIWIAFGNPISHFPELQKSEARQRIESELASVFKNLYAELQQTFQLTMDDLPHPPRERMTGNGGGRSRQDAATQHPCDMGVVRGKAKESGFHRYAASGIDAFLCASMNFLQARHRLNGRSREEMERYVEQCERLTADQYYASPHDDNLAEALGNGHPTIRWRSPIETQFPANNIACADFFPSERGRSAATVFILHALMSTSPIGYRRCAEHFNELGWNACFIELPYHYSRVPRGYWNGELAITCNLIRNAEGLRQGVMELRQLMSALRECGSGEFGVLATSYGGWIGALLAMVERDLRFVALMAPIVNIEHAIWESPAARSIRRELHRANIEPSLVARHFHLSSPLHNVPLSDPARVLFVAGEFDSIAPLEQLERIQQKWRGSELLRVRQGHFGYRMLRETVERLKQRGDL
ncbi:MAG TPA: 1-acyl-sn-glycerol-3-phosphate acyltransferase [Candidatus Udaeobacter sp.]|nr:1-acyl-sn-glycerol-3-phosphate acyltransferase [Candidatus Udaeobacter sp.]